MLVPKLCSPQRFLGQIQCWYKSLNPYRLKMVWLCAHQFLSSGRVGKANPEVVQPNPNPGLSKAPLDTHLPAAFPAVLLLWGVQLSSANF